MYFKKIIGQPIDNKHGSPFIYLIEEQYHKVNRF